MHWTKKKHFQSKGTRSQNPWADGRTTKAEGSRPDPACRPEAGLRWRNPVRVGVLGTGSPPPPRSNGSRFFEMRRTLSTIYVITKDQVAKNLTSIFLQFVSTLYTYYSLILSSVCSKENHRFLFLSLSASIFSTTGGES